MGHIMRRIESRKYEGFSRDHDEISLDVYVIWDIKRGKIVSLATLLFMCTRKILPY